MRAIRLNSEGQIEVCDLQVSRCVLCGAKVEEAQVCSSCIAEASEYSEEDEVTDGQAAS